MSETVQVSRRLLYALVTVTLLSMMGLCFLLGRASVAPVPLSGAVTPPVAAAGSVEPVSARPLHTGPVPAQPAAPPASALAVAAPASSVAVSSPSSAALAPAPIGTNASATGARPARPVPAPAATAEARKTAPAVGSTSPQQAARIRNYLAEVEAITAGTEALGDPTEFASGLLNEAMLGQTGGIDNLIAQAGQARQRLAQIQPPPECAEHHKLMSQQLGSSYSMLQKLKTALVTSDTEALTSLASQGRGMQTQANRLQQVTEKLKQKAGSAG